MTARDEIAEIIDNRWHGYGYNPQGAADAILAAGYRKPRTITTHAELDALPEGSVVLDAEGRAAVIRPTVDGHRCLLVAKAGDNLWAFNSLVSQRMLPATVLHEGGAA